MKMWEQNSGRAARKNNGDSARRKDCDSKENLLVAAALILIRVAPTISTCHSAAISNT